MAKRKSTLPSKIRVFNGVSHFVQEMLVFHGRPAMGADIYLQSEYERKSKEFDLDMKRAALDTARERGEDMTKARADFEAALLQTEEGTYFRDSYNSSNLAWLVGLSYWVEGEHLDKDGNLPPHRQVHWLNTLQQADIKVIVTDAIENYKKNAKLGAMSDDRLKPELGLEPNEKVEDVIRYFEKKKERLMALLTKGIELNEALEWSV